MDSSHVRESSDSYPGYYYWDASKTLMRRTVTREYDSEGAITKEVVEEEWKESPGWEIPNFIPYSPIPNYNPTPVWS